MTLGKTEPLRKLTIVSVKNVNKFKELHEKWDLLQTHYKGKVNRNSQEKIIYGEWWIK